MDKIYSGTKIPNYYLSVRTYGRCTYRQRDLDERAWTRRNRTSPASRENFFSAGGPLPWIGALARRLPETLNETDPHARGMWHVYASLQPNKETDCRSLKNLCRRRGEKKRETILQRESRHTGDPDEDLMGHSEETLKKNLPCFSMVFV